MASSDKNLDEKKGDKILRRLLKMPPQPKEAAPKGTAKPSPKPKKKPAK
jgi:negative regulator of replication initiation